MDEERTDLALVVVFEKVTVLAAPLRGRGDLRVLVAILAHDFLRLVLREGQVDADEPVEQRLHLGTRPVPVHWCKDDEAVGIHHLAVDVLLVHEVVRAVALGVAGAGVVAVEAVRRTDAALARPDLRLGVHHLEVYQRDPDVLWEGVDGLPEEEGGLGVAAGAGLPCPWGALYGYDFDLGVVVPRGLCEVFGVTSHNLI